MNQENIEVSKPAAQVSGSETKGLSQQVFDDPIEFLRVLRSDFKQMAQSNPKELSKNDLIIYSQQGSDEKGRLAARIAVDHYDELLHMPEAAAHWSGRNIKPSDLNLDIKMAQGKVAGTIAGAVLRDGATAATMGVGAVVFGAFTTGLLECPPLAILGGVTTAVIVGAAGVTGIQAIKDPSEIRAKSEKDRQILHSWPEVNGGKAS